MESADVDPGGNQSGEFNKGNSVIMRRELDEFRASQEKSRIRPSLRKFSIEKNQTYWKKNRGILLEPTTKIIFRTSFPIGQT